jgi:hypothetical protein
LAATWAARDSQHFHGFQHFGNELRARTDQECLEHSAPSRDGQTVAGAAITQQTVIREVIAITIGFNATVILAHTFERR